MLKKMVNGKEIICSDQEEQNILSYWKMNTDYPDFQGCCGFDGVNPPFHIIEDARKICINFCNAYYQKEIDDLSVQIEVAQEDGNDALVKDLLAKRKEFRALMNPDVSAIHTVEELHKMLPK